MNNMNKDLGLPAAAFWFGAGLFFIGYFIFEVPSNLIFVVFHLSLLQYWYSRTYHVAAPTCKRDGEGTESKYIVDYSIFNASLLGCYIFNVTF
jgi:hypothetical protein